MSGVLVLPLPEQLLPEQLLPPGAAQRVLRHSPPRALQKRRVPLLPPRGQFD
jgi:hypothetical protein